MALKFGQAFANQVRRRQLAAGGKRHLDEVVLTIAGVKHWLWRAVDQTGMVLDTLVQSRRDTQVAKRLSRKLLTRQCRAPRVMVTDELASYGAAKRKMMLSVERRMHKGGPCYQADVQLARGPARPGAVLLDQPLACAAQFQARVASYSRQFVTLCFCLGM